MNLGKYKNILLIVLAILVILAILAAVGINLPLIGGYDYVAPLLALTGMVLAFGFLPRNILFWVIHILFALVFIVAVVNLIPGVNLNIGFVDSIASYIPILLAGTVAFSYALNKKK